LQKEKKKKMSNLKRKETREKKLSGPSRRKEWNSRKVAHYKTH